MIASFVDDQNPRAGPPRRPIQFNLRTLLILVAIAGLAFALLRIVYAPGRHFDEQAWANEELVQVGERREMADDLIDHGTLKGMRRAEVVAMLGEPPRTGYFRGWDLVYWLGPERGFFGIDSEWLVIRFGKDGRVSNYQIVTD